MDSGKAKRDWRKQLQQLQPSKQQPSRKATMAESSNVAMDKGKRTLPSGVRVASGSDTGKVGKGKTMSAKVTADTITFEGFSGTV